MPEPKYQYTIICCENEIDVFTEKENKCSSCGSTFVISKSTLSSKLWVPFWEEKSSGYTSGLYPRSIKAAAKWLIGEILRNADKWEDTSYSANRLKEIASLLIKDAEGFCWVEYGNHKFVLRPATEQEIIQGKLHGDTSDFITIIRKDN